MQYFYALLIYRQFGFIKERSSVVQLYNILDQCTDI
jgi:hypothetical protein